MKKSRIIVLFLALAAAGGAFMLATGPGTPPPAPVAALPPPPPPPTTDDVVAAARDLPLGTKIAESDLAWQSWPKDSVPANTLRRSQKPQAFEELKGSIVRSALFQGELVRTEKLIKGDNSGFMSAILPTGMRAVAINIDSQGATTAGGFILPNDRVDVVRTYRQEPKPGAAPTGGDNYLTDTLLSNVKVLAIGQNVQEKNGQPVVVGSNATLELDPEQAEVVILAQRTGQLSLVLRSMLDAHQAGTVAARQASHGLSVVRYGNISEDHGR
ncbi:Flp pilus assembly protein CpaB [Lichenibacterium ramalinae]|uniref:Flp pilus assembly protein CpaB n=1 Tax=Lichenibacterium ramalinae TaxID=2316527 RepID=A0A4Q2RI34_9HYPH|nr:Flp pilus assembly protein CpaB [Lichenibacterium ramalinae]RYB07666.1 Flp pilus assembly protein CpaB [Lichenibacterium ramalinae]